MKKPRFLPKAAALLLALALVPFGGGCALPEFDPYSTLPDIELPVIGGGYYITEDTEPVYPFPETAPDTGDLPEPVPTVDGDAGSWAIYWYLCGSDLESEHGCATYDLEEMMSVKLPENVTIVVQTGGAFEWQNDYIDSDYISRYTYTSEGFDLIEKCPLDNMGDGETFEEFLGFCSENYPADNTMVLLWNHGGGSVSGVAFDENYDYDALTLEEMYGAFGNVYKLSTDYQPIDIIGFDACLMATVDTAYTFWDVARYMVASEEVEPGNGWAYDGICEAFARDPSISAEELGRAICDSYLEGCEYYGTDSNVTLSCVDLSNVRDLIYAYDSLGDTMLVYACADPTFFASMGRAASHSENYGGNTDYDGYTNLVDLGDLVYNSADLMPYEADALLDALERCVVYKVNGRYRKDASGLSCYYSYDGDYGSFLEYADVGFATGIEYYFDYCLRGDLSDDGLSYLADILGFNDEEDDQYSQWLDDNDAYSGEVESLDWLEDYPVYIDDEAIAHLDIGADTASMLSGVYMNLSFISPEDDLLVVLGSDNDLIGDWENGVFSDNFRGVWAAIDECYCFMEIVEEGDDYNVYSTPILLNGEPYVLQSVYDFNDEEYRILGVRHPNAENGMADRDLRLLRPGDEITTVHYAGPLFSDGEMMEIPMDTVTVTEDTRMEEMWLGDGAFVLGFEMVDYSGTSYYSDYVVFEVEGDDIYARSFEDYLEEYLTDEAEEDYGYYGSWESEYNDWYYDEYGYDWFGGHD